MLHMIPYPVFPIFTLTASSKHKTCLKPQHSSALLNSINWIPSTYSINAMALRTAATSSPFQKM
jgi:hypothetical protein